MHCASLNMTKVYPCDFVRIYSFKVFWKLKWSPAQWFSQVIFNWTKLVKLLRDKRYRRHYLLGGGNQHPKYLQQYLPHRLRTTALDPCNVLIFLQPRNATERHRTTRHSLLHLCMLKIHFVVRWQKRMTAALCVQPHNYSPLSYLDIKLAPLLM